MALFEFLMVLVSLIVGLGLAEILTGVARTMRCRGFLKLYWVHGLLVLAIFIALLQQWWEIWGLRGQPEWSFQALLVMLTAPVCLFLIAHLLFPDSLRDADLHAYYHEEMRPVWLLGATAVVASTAFRPIFFDEPLFAADNATSFATLAGFLMLYFSQQRSLHAICVSLFSVLLLLDILLWNPVIQG